MIAKPLSACPLVVKLAVSERTNLNQEPSYERLSADPVPKAPSGSRCTPVHVPQDPLSSAQNYGTHSVRLRHGKGTFTHSPVSSILLDSLSSTILLTRLCVVFKPLRDAASADRTSGLCRSAADQLDTGKRHFIIQIAAHVTSVN